jgi:hypothetical protein
MRESRSTAGELRRDDADHKAELEPVRVLGPQAEREPQRRVAEQRERPAGQFRKFLSTLASRG